MINSKILEQYCRVYDNRSKKILAEGAPFGIVDKIKRLNPLRAGYEKTSEKFSQERINNMYKAFVNAVIEAGRSERDITYRDLVGYLQRYLFDAPESQTWLNMSRQPRSSKVGSTAGKLFTKVVQEVQSYRLTGSALRPNTPSPANSSLTPGNQSKINIDKLKQRLGEVDKNTMTEQEFSAFIKKHLDELRA